MPEDYISVAEAAEKLGISAARVGQLIKSGDLKATKISRVWLLRPEDVEAFKGRAPHRPKSWTAELEREVLRMSAQGRSTAEIAEALGKTPGAVEIKLRRLKK